MVRKNKWSGMHLRTLYIKITLMVSCVGYYHTFIIRSVVGWSIGLTWCVLYENDSWKMALLMLLKATLYFCAVH